jgi:radical SAM family uncharacterized protein
MSLSPKEIEIRLERVLLNVQKPGRYTGGEVNQIVKDWETTRTHIALAFPDIYDIGLPNLGLAILYDAINQRGDACAERVYSPWVDMEDAMRQSGIPIYSLESKHSLDDFDIIGITLPYETLYTNALNLLDLAGLPIYAKDRTEAHPLVIAGGHATYNPEPMAAFIDAFLIGEGEEAIHEIINCYQTWKQNTKSRPALLHALARISGVYVPILYQVDYHTDGSIQSIRSLEPAAPYPVVKRITAKMPAPLTRFIVPSVDVVHNRVSVEIMRGCTRGCRFCHAGMVTRPVRQRPVEEIIQSVQAALDATGYEEVALLSLSSSDYTQIVELIQGLRDQLRGQRVTISLPSLRIESFSVELMEQLQEAKPTGGFTLAPEAATERMRQIINKPVSTQQLLETARAVYGHGWNNLKLYFMIGHPSETLEDVQAIADLCRAVLVEGRQAAGGRARLNVGISTFVPKAHTPFQWVASDNLDIIRTKLDLLKRSLRHPSIKLSWSEPEDSFLEAWLARGDRRMGEVIRCAWQKGARFDAWQDQYRYSIWQEAFTETGLDPAFYSHRTRGLEEIFPWDHISTGVRKSYLAQDYQWSLDGRIRPDCREQCYACGILPAFSELRLRAPGIEWNCP